MNRGKKLKNEYVTLFGELYKKTPKAVFAAIAASLLIQISEEHWEEAPRAFLREWQTLHENGLIPQKPPKILE